MNSLNSDILEALKAFRCLRLRVEVKATRTIQLPPYLGSTIRGAFGLALRQSCCVLRRQVCCSCLLRSRCVYSYTFETPLNGSGDQARRYASAPHPFVLNLDIHSPGTREVGSTFSFGVTLIGRAAEFLPYFVHAFQRMGELGLGKGRGTFELVRVVSPGADGGHEKELYADGELRMPEARLNIEDALHGVEDAGEMEAPHEEGLVHLGGSFHSLLEGGAGGCASDADSTPLQPPSRGEFTHKRVRSSCRVKLGGERQWTASSDLELRFETPVRFVQRGELIREVHFPLLVGNLLRRLENLVRFHCGGTGEWVYGSLLDRAAEVELAEDGTRWYDWERYSGRQDRRMKLGGLVGQVLYRGDTSPFLPLLTLGQWVHVGKNTSFGLGRFQLDLQKGYFSGRLG
jgi:hypothetical protein